MSAGEKRQGRAGQKFQKDPPTCGSCAALPAWGREAHSTPRARAARTVNPATPMEWPEFVWRAGGADHTADGKPLQPVVALGAVGSRGRGPRSIVRYNRRGRRTGYNEAGGACKHSTACRNTPRQAAPPRRQQRRLSQPARRNAKLVLHQLAASEAAPLQIFLHRRDHLQWRHRGLRGQGGAGGVQGCGGRRGKSAGHG